MLALADLSDPQQYGRPFALVPITIATNELVLTMTWLGSESLDLLADSYENDQAICSSGLYNPRCEGLVYTSRNKNVEYNPNLQSLTLDPKAFEDGRKVVIYVAGTQGIDVAASSPKIQLINA